MKNRVAVRVFTVFISALSVLPASSQTAVESAIPAAERLRDAGDFAGAVAVLRTEVAERPENRDAARLLAQTLYWLGDRDGARVAYDAALARYPHDTTLRLQYARMLAETGDHEGARVLATPLQATPETSAEANALLGTLAYWKGDLTTARRRFETALSVDPTLADVRRQLRDILSVTTPWIRVAADLQHDDQPLDRAALGVEAGWFATPLTLMRLRVKPHRYRVDHSTTHALWDGELSLAHFAAALRLDTELAGGIVRRTHGEGRTHWQGRGALGLRLPAHIKIGVRLERLPYLYTIASLDVPVMVSGATNFVRWDDPRGWLGEAAYQAQRYPDGNSAATAYGWLLAPLVNRPAGRLQAGYALAREHAADSRFVLANPEQPYPPGDPRFDLSGRYDPYFTPNHLLTHSVIAAVTARPARTTVTLGGTYAVRATENVPGFVASADQVQQTMTLRSLTPWEIRGSVDVALKSHLTLTTYGEVRRTAFYRWSMAGLRVTYRFAGAGIALFATP